MPWIENEGEEDAEFIEFIKNYNEESRPNLMKLLDKYSDKDIFIFNNRDEAEEFERLGALIVLLLYYKYMVNYKYTDK